MEDLKINLNKDVLNTLKRVNEEVNAEKFIKFRGKYKPKLWIVEYNPIYGEETLFRVPNSLVWNTVNRECDDSVLEFIKNEIIKVVPNMCNDVYFTQNIRTFSKLVFDNRNAIKYDYNYMIQLLGY